MSVGLDVIHITGRLQHNAAVFSALLEGVADAQARWKPEPDKWSILEVVNHLGDEEEQDFRMRLRLLLDEPQRDWPPIDPARWAIDRQYNKREPAESLERFLRARMESLEWLHTLRGRDWERMHEGKVGPPLRAGDLLCSWLGHDLIHIRQINRLHREYLTSVCPGFSPDYAGAW